MTHVSETILESDKYYWHRYTEFYEQHFAKLQCDPKIIIEFGVFHGASIRWLLERFPGARIFGLDILPPQHDWPVHSRVTYSQVDQGDRPAIARALSQIEGEADLMIEDGSHIPQHQAACLTLGLEKVSSGGIFISEDISTSHPMNSAFAHFSHRHGKPLPTALHVLMAIQHNKDLGLTDLSSTHAAALADVDFFTPSDVSALFESIQSIDIFKRTKLPLRCYSCGQSDFDYTAWRCRCGVNLNQPDDSMAALIVKK